jgi:hypothetical protein
MQLTLAAMAAFNLVCDVQRFGDDVMPAISARTLTFRIDPILGRWCEGSCPAAAPIAAMSASEIVLAYRRADGHGPGQAIRIATLAGRYDETSFGLQDGEERSDFVGTCRRAPFSGFPPESLRLATPLRVEVPPSID